MFYDIIQKGDYYFKRCDQDFRICELEYVQDDKGLPYVQDDKGLSDAQDDKGLPDVQD